MVDAPHIMIVESRYYEEIAEELINSVIFELESVSATYERFEVPGAFEIPTAIKFAIDAQANASSLSSFDGFIALGCVIKGKTPHFELISKAVTNALMYLSVTHKKPIGNGIITCFNKKQALERVDKGAEASLAVKKVILNRDD